MKFKSQVVTQASGSVGGITASRNAGGMYFRARAIPTNPSSTYQVEVRNAMNQAVQRWSQDLSDAQRSAWGIYAFNTPVTNALGDQIKLSGFNMYVRSNVARLQAGLSPVDSAPTIYNLGSMGPVALAGVDASDNEAEFTFNNTYGWAAVTGGALLVAISRPQSQTINFFKGPYRLAGVILGNTGSPPTSPAVVTLPFPVSAGQKVFAQVRATLADGRLTAPVRFFQLASA